MPSYVDPMRQSRNRRFLPMSMMAGLVLIGFASAMAQAQGVASNVQSLGELVDLLKTQMIQNQQVRQQISPMLATARKILDQPLVKRIQTYEELVALDGKTARKLSFGRPKAMPHASMKYHFARATSDTETTTLLSHELPYLAAAYRLTDDKIFLNHIIAQLREMATWSPLQRPGWTTASSKRLEPPKGGDGVWLATGMGIRTIVFTRQVLPTGSLPKNLEDQLDALLLREMNEIYNDWITQKPWYVQKQAVQSNQWVVPNEGLMLAACSLGKNKYSKEYTLAVENLSKTMATYGSEGALSEGFIYAISLTLQGVQSSAMAMAQAGDDSVITHPFFQKYGNWLVQHYQPGEYLINYFDAWGTNRRMYDRWQNERIAILASLSGNKALLWALKNQHKQLPHSLFGMLAAAMIINDPNLPTPPTQSTWNIARSAIWRSSWDSNASGLWVRGRHPKDFHVHHDAGHVNFIVGGQAALIETGTPGYRNKRFQDDYRSVRGHNVLQVDEDLKTIIDNDVPIVVSKMDQTGGELTVTPTIGYKQLENWTRNIQWDKTKLTINDQVKVKDGQQHDLSLRFHLATQQPLTVTAIRGMVGDSATEFKVTVPKGRIEFSGWAGSKRDYWIIPKKDIILTPAMSFVITSQTPIEVIASEHVNHTLRHRYQEMPHKMLLIKTVGKAPTLNTTVMLEVTPNTDSDS